MIKSVFIIAEAGVNHNGSITIAKKMIDRAKEIGADAIKFQSFKADKLTVKNAQKAAYQKNTTEQDQSQYEMLKSLELSKESHFELFNYCKLKNIVFLSSPFDMDSIDLLVDIGVEQFKVPSGEINNIPYLRKLGQFGKPILLSTGMSTLGEIENALTVLTDAGIEKNRITVLHCNTEYPTPMEDVNLRAMLTIKNAFGVNVGYSDHTKGIEVAIAAVAMGAAVIEKHFTLDRSMPGPDQLASIECDMFESMVKAIRNIEIALGDGIKVPSQSELKNKEIVRKSIVAITSIKKGQKFTKENIGLKRPATGLPPLFWDFVIGKTAQREYDPDELIDL